MKTKFISCALAVVAASCVLPGAAQVPDQLKHNIPAPFGTAQSGAQIGWSVATEGSYTVAAAPYADAVGSDAGAVKVFNSATGAPLFVIPSPAPASSDHFGFSVAISGSRLVIGAPDNDIGGTDAGIVYIYDLSSAAPTVPVALLRKPGPVAGDGFGRSVSISGARVVVGATGDDTGATDAGSAYVYDLVGSTPTVPVVILNNPDPAANDLFGNTVSISGAMVAVGAMADDTGAPDAGSVYIYDLENPAPSVPVVTLNNPSPGSYDYFGKSAAISGMLVVVGAPYDKPGLSDAGSAYVYNLAGPTPATPIATLNDPGFASFDYFGNAVSISGTQILVGATGQNSISHIIGTVYVYDFGSGIPSAPAAVLRNPIPSSAEDFGTSVAVSQTRVVVGAPRNDSGAVAAGTAYLFDLSSITPTTPIPIQNNPGPSTGDQFGTSVALSGTKLVIGTPNDDIGASNAGRAYVYDLGGSSPGTPVFILNNPAPASGDIFGSSVSISGMRVVVGAPSDDGSLGDAGTAYVYDLSSATPTIPIATLNNPTPQYSDFFGCSVAISGTRIVVGAYLDDTKNTDAGSAYVYDLANGTPTVPIFTLVNPGPSAEAHFGASVAISGTQAVIAAPAGLGGFNAARVYIYSFTSGTPTVPVRTLSNPGSFSTQQFGNAVAAAGTRVIVGSSSESGTELREGRAYVYDTSSATPTVPVATLSNPTPGLGDEFGNSVAISGTRVVVGARRDDTGATDAGSVYVFDVSSPTPLAVVSTLANPAPDAFDVFGSSVAIDGTTIAVGAPGDGTIASAKGYTYAFGPSPYSLWKVTQLNNQFASDFGDADRDGLSNLGEYGLLRSPTTPNSAATIATLALYAEGERLRMFVPRDPARNDVTLEVQATGALSGTWTTLATSVLGAPFSGPGYFGGDSPAAGVKSVEVRDTVNVSDAQKRFMRVRVRH